MNAKQRLSLPEQGTPWPALQERLTGMGARDVDWRGGRTAVYVFHPGDDVLDVAHDAYGAFISENALGPGAFPSLKTMEREVVDMALSLQQAPPDAAGSMTSGGTESIIMAVKAARDAAQAARTGKGNGGSGADAPFEIVAPHTVHPAFDKAAHYLGLSVVRVPVGDDLRADVAAMEAAITPHTIMLVGSAPCFPFGVIDPIAALSDLALSRSLWLHVDACVGGYINPFVRALGEPVPAYDFSLPGVTSMSADLHKYGYAAKGASTVLYRDKSLRDFQVFKFDNWPAGSMSTPTMAGTRPGGAIAAAWAVMNYLGQEGYTERAAAIVRARKRLEKVLPEMGLKVLSDPEVSLIVFGSADESVDILAVGAGLYEHGWMSSRTTEPAGIHLMLSPRHEEMLDDYLEILAQLVDEVRSGTRKGSGEPVRYS